MKEKLKFIPFLIVFLTALPLNIDIVVIPSLTKGGIHILFWTIELPHIFPEFSVVEVFLIVSGLSVTFTSYFYWFLGWLFREYSKDLIGKLSEKEPISEGVQLWKKIKKQFRKELEKYFSKLYEWATDEENKLIKRLRRGGYPTIFFLSMVPEPGTRTVATIFARSLNSKLALSMVILGETFKNAIILGIWNLAFWIF